MTPPPQANTSLLSRQDIRLLVELGFMAANLGHAREADAIFEAMQLLLPASAVPHLGVCLARMGEGKHAQAVQHLRKTALRTHAHDEDVQLFLAWALTLDNRREEADAVLRTLASGSANSPARQVALGLVPSAGKEALSLVSLVASTSRSLASAT